MRKQRFWYAAAAATVLLAAGCNGGADNQPSPTPTPTVSSPTASPSDSGSPSPSASVSIPAEAMAQTPEGAVAFVKFFFDEVNRAYLEPNGGILPGDIIIRWDGEEVPGVMAMMEHLASHEPGDVAQIVVNRDGQEVALLVTMLPRAEGG